MPRHPLFYVVLPVEIRMKPVPGSPRTKLQFTYKKWSTGQAIVMAAILLGLFLGMYALAVSFKSGIPR
jgi:hypothetical protein